MYGAYKDMYGAYKGMYVRAKDAVDGAYKLIDSFGKVIKGEKLSSNSIHLARISKRVYFLIFPKMKETFKIIKQ